MRPTPQKRERLKMAMVCKMRTGYLVGVTGSKIVIFLSLGGHLPCDTRDPVQQISQ